MTTEYFQMKDKCREGLTRHLETILSRIPNRSPLRMLDAGCGTGVPTLLLAARFEGPLTALDMDNRALAHFSEKIRETDCSQRIQILNTSLFDYVALPDSYDLILAEGLLNVVGFEKGFDRLSNWLCPDGWFVIHDEYKDHEAKLDYFRKKGYVLADSAYLDENTWWNDYYSELQKQIRGITDAALAAQFRSDILELDYFKTDPAPFRSIYYVVHKN